MNKPKKQDLSPISRRAFFARMAGRTAVAGATGLAASQLMGCPLRNEGEYVDFQGEKVRADASR